MIAQLVEQHAAQHLVVHFSRPVGPAERARLVAAGMKLLNYLGDNAFFASVSRDSTAPAALSAVRSLDHAGRIETVWKLHPVFAQGIEPTWVTVSRNSVGEATIGAYVLFHPDVPLAPDGVRAVKQHRGVVRDRIPSVNGLVIEIALSQVAALAQEDIVQYIEPALPPMEGLNSENRTLTGAEVVQASPYNLDGTGVTVLVYDAGRAMTSTGATHPDVGGRITLGDTSPWSDHAAHVTCTVGGDGSQSVGGMHRGMAPGASLLSYGFESDGTLIPLYSNPGDLETDYAQAITLHGADLANNSIGTNTCENGFPCAITGDYGVTSALIDNIVRGSLGAPFRVVYANGNERACALCPLQHQGGYYSTAPPATAKNHITVGAVNANDDSMTSFSSWGPTDDGRIKPDISAPGCQVGGDGGVTSCNTAFGLFGYSVKCGTSMAAPTVSGLAALLLQDFRVQFPAKPDFRNSTLKILLAHNAVDIGNTGPDYQSGYGSVRIQPTIDFMRSGAFLEDQVAHAATFTTLVTVVAGDPQLKVTLAWDDVAGTPNVSPSLVNDLDLHVFDSLDVQFFPWTLDPANPALPAVQTQADHLNNIEQVVINAPAAGTYRVEVHGFNVPQGPQPFSLAASPSLALPGELTLVPISTELPVATQHSLTATFHDSAAPFDPVPGVLVTFEVLSGPNIGILGSDLTDVNGEATIAYIGVNLEGTDQIQASLDDAGTPRLSNIATAIWVAGQITLAPATGSGTECAGHTVTADVFQGAAPFAAISGVTVTFDVISGPNMGMSGTDVTDAAGMATFTYPGTGGPGTDTIQASFVDASATQFSNTVSRTWTASALDCNLNATPDECEIGWDQDCNGNGTADLCDLTRLPGFDPVAPHTVDANPFAIVAGELNGLPGIDLATGSNGFATASVLLNNGDGTFATSTPFPLDSMATGLTMADFDRDGDQDLAAVTDNDTVSVLLNNGNGTFVTTGPFATLGDTPTWIATDDFDGINGPDLVVANKRDDGVNFFVTVMLNSGTGTFPTTVRYFVADFPAAVTVGDVDGVNGPDIVTAAMSVDAISVLLNNGNGTFAPMMNYPGGGSPASVTLADLDADLDLDLVITESDFDKLRIMKNNGSGAFSFSAQLTVGLVPMAATAADLDGDGDLDLAVANYGSLVVPGTTITVLINKSDGVFVVQPPTNLGASFPRSLVAEDFDQDGELDIAIAHEIATSNVSVLPGLIFSTSVDCDGNAIPDECEPDADVDGVPDACDLCPGTLPATTVDATGCPPGFSCSSAGTMMLDAATYTCADTAFIQVVDCDLNANAGSADTVNVTLSSTAEPAGETVTLTETAADSSVFVSSIPLSTTDGIGILRITSGETITATYLDADDGLGGTDVVVTDTASVPGDCLDVTVQLEAVNTPVTRTLTFVITDCVGPTAETIIQAIDFDSAGMGTVTLTLTIPGADWISAVESHTLRHLLPLGPPLPTSISFSVADRLVAGDYTGDSLVDVEDLSTLASRWDAFGDVADANGDGVQDMLDFLAALANILRTGDAVDGCGP